MKAEKYTGPHSFSMPSWIGCAPFERLLSITIVFAEEGKAVLSMPFYEQYAQGAGLMHGGALLSLADTAAVMAVKSLTAPGTHFATISVESRFHHPVKQGILSAEAAAEECGERMLRGHCDILDESKRTVMSFDAVYKIASDANIRNISFNIT